VLEEQIRWAKDSNDLIVVVRATQLAALKARWLIRLSLREIGVGAAMALDTAPDRPLALADSPPPNGPGGRGACMGRALPHTRNCAGHDR